MEKYEFSKIEKSKRRYAGVCSMCKEENLKKHMTTIRISIDEVGTLRTMCHVCKKCMPDVMRYFGVEVP